MGKTMGFGNVLSHSGEARNAAERGTSSGRRDAQTKGPRILQEEVEIAESKRIILMIIFRSLLAPLAPVQSLYGLLPFPRYLAKSIISVRFSLLFIRVIPESW
jgi:hypothetical protein